MQVAFDAGRNQIIIDANLKLGLPMENINKIAGPIVEAWEYEPFQDVVEDKNNEYHLITVEAQQGLHMADVILQFKKKRKVESGITVEADIKATSEDFESSGKTPNIGSFPFSVEQCGIEQEHGPWMNRISKIFLSTDPAMFN